MAEILNTYRLVKLIDKSAKRIEKQSPKIRTIPETYDFVEPATSDVKRQYRHKYKFTSDRTLHLLIASAKKKKYIEEVRTLDKELEVVINVLRIVSPKGWDLIERSLFGLIPKGLLLAWVEKNKDFSSLVIGFIGGIVVGTIGIAIAIIKLHNKH